MVEFEAFCVYVLDRRVSYYGVYLNTLGGESRILTGTEIRRRIGSQTVHPEIASVLQENHIARFETEQVVRDVVEFLKEAEAEKRA